MQEAKEAAQINKLEAERHKMKLEDSAAQRLTLEVSIEKTGRDERKI